ncbi:MFS transporter [Heyndrickxia sporothermodurans]
MNRKLTKSHASETPIPMQAKKLMLVNALRSIGQGMLVVNLALYLHALGWSTAAIGSVLAAGGLLSVGLSPVIGIYSDRLGRKPFILIYEFLTAGCAVVGVFSTDFLLLFLAITFSGFGKADAGSPSPCVPAEQAWLATFIPTENRGKVYSLNNALSFFGMAAGAVMAGSAALWEGALFGATSYRVTFFIVFSLYLVTALIIFTIGEEEIIHSRKEETEILEKEILNKENLAVFKLAGINVLNGIAIGLTGPMMSYWFAAKFGASTTQIGGTLALTFFATGVTSLFQAKLSRKHGTIRSIVLVRFIASLLLILMPLLSSYILASILYIIRTALNRGTQGAQQALSVSLTRDKRRGFASSINSLSMRLPISVGPYISGYFFGLGSLAMPFYIASGLQISFAYLYGRIFSTYEFKLKSHTSSG